jgi:acyl-CoA reductase-like NAD-dependent aldehyde dehydrogenase
MKLLSTNPSQNYALVGEVEVSTLNEIQDKVSLAAAAKGSWRDAGLSRRVEFIRLIRDEFEKRHDEISNLICAEVGKPIQHSRNEAKYYTRELDWFMDNAPAALCDEITFEDKRSIHKITYEPFGVVAVISPWNYPFGMAMWGIIPNLLAGNTVVFKASEECPLMGKLIEEVLRHHLPNGVFNEVYGPGEVGEQLSEGDIDMIWFTGRQIY